MRKKVRPGARRRDRCPGRGRLPIGVVGMGQMGTTIAACLLAAGHPVAGVEINPSRRRILRRRLRKILQRHRQERLLEGKVEIVLKRLTLSDDVAILGGCAVVIESVIENLAIKRRVIGQIEGVVAPEALIASNTSRIPITTLQRGARHPGRILGMHWCDPAHVSRFMEIIPGRDTDPAAVSRAAAWARRWGKDPAVLKRDAPGFIVNRIGYAMLREALHIVQAGIATVEDVDRALRHSVGTWLPIAGPFRMLDRSGVEKFETVMRRLLPDLSRSTRVPPMMSRLLRERHRGFADRRGFYRYTAAEVRDLERRFRDFSYRLQALQDAWDGAEPG